MVDESLFMPERRKIRSTGFNAISLQANGETELARTTSGVSSVNTLYFYLTLILRRAI